MLEYIFTSLMLHGNSLATHQTSQLGSHGAYNISTVSAVQPRLPDDKGLNPAFSQSQAPPTSTASRLGLQLPRHPNSHRGLRTASPATAAQPRVEPPATQVVGHKRAVEEVAEAASKQEEQMLASLRQAITSLKDWRVAPEVSGLSCSTRSSVTATASLGEHQVPVAASATLRGPHKDLIRETDVIAMALIQEFLLSLDQHCSRACLDGSIGESLWQGAMLSVKECCETFTVVELLPTTAVCCCICRFLNNSSFC